MENMLFSSTVKLNAGFGLIVLKRGERKRKGFFMGKKGALNTFYLLESP